MLLEWQTAQWPRAAVYMQNCLIQLKIWIKVLMLLAKRLASSNPEAMAMLKKKVMWEGTEIGTLIN